MKVDYVLRVGRLTQKIGACLCLLAVAALALAGCGGSGGGDSVSGRTEGTTVSEKKSEVPEIFKIQGPLECPSRSEDIAVTLDTDPSAANAGIMMAASRGYFSDVGLQVSVGGPKNPARTVKYVAAGIDDFGVAQLPQVVMSPEEGGAPLVAVGSVIPQSNLALIWSRDSGIRDVADLEGKTIAIPGVPFQEGLLELVLEEAGLSLEDVAVKRANYKSAAALLDGRADAIFGATWNIEGVELEASGAEPVIKRARSLGLPEYEELVVIAPAKCATKNPGIVRDFMAAVSRGTAAAQSHPAEAAKLISQNYEFDPRFRMSTLRAQLAATLPLLSRDPEMNLPQATALTVWMHKEGMIKRLPPVGDMFTNGYLEQ
jgi:putative hydroxymethylpyrimidine transport system substrate-binding protein